MNKLLTFDQLENRTLMSTWSAAPIPNVTGPLTAVSAKELRQYYGFTGKGAGVTIAIVDAFNYEGLSKDLSLFDKHNHLSKAQLNIINLGQQGNTAWNTGWDLEEDLDD